jgi:hypothetical protein
MTTSSKEQEAKKVKITGKVKFHFYNSITDMHYS